MRRGRRRRQPVYLIVGTVDTLVEHEIRVGRRTFGRRRRVRRHVGRPRPPDGPSLQHVRARVLVAVVLPEIARPGFAARLGDRGTPEAMRRVGQFTSRAERGDDD